MIHDPSTVRTAHFTTALASIALGAACVFAIPCAQGANSLSFKPNVIYGEDGRHEVTEETDPARRAVADSTLGMIEAKSLRRMKNGTFEILAESYQKEYGLCSTERFVDQRVAPVCTGFLIAPDLVATAGHCVNNAKSCRENMFVFGYQLDRSGHQPSSLPASEVYSCKEVIASSEDPGSGFSSDFTVLRLDRPVRDHRPLKLRESGSLAKGDEVFVVGHPSGLPLKISGGAKIRALRGVYAVANLDTYSGNSGSPVFNARTLEVEGILVAGEEDFVSAGKCYVSNHCSDEGCRGEDITLISEILPFLPKADQSQNADQSLATTDAISAD